MDNKDTPYWYMRLTSKFFTDPEIKNIKALPETTYGINFSEFCICLYLEMLCVSIPNDGVLLFRNSYLDNDNIAYAVARRYERRNKENLVQMSLMVLEQEKLIEFGEVPEGKTIFIPAVLYNTGSAKISSDQRRQRRLKAKKKQEENLLLIDREKKEKQKIRCGALKNLYITEEQLNNLDRLVSLKNKEKILYKAGMEKIKILEEGDANRKIDDYEIILSILKKYEDINE